MDKRSYRLGVLLVVTMYLAACSGNPAPSIEPTSPAQAISSPTSVAAPEPPTKVAPTATATQAPVATAEPTVAATAIPAADQPTAGTPRFTNPTQITNRFYPISLTARAIAVGQDHGQASRNEVSILPATKTVTWNGQQIEACITQFVAFTNGKLVEVAYDYFAQADDGSVYYIGEDVGNYTNGIIVSHEGSWLTGQDGAPAALIMPAQPQVGQRFNPENLPGVVFESDEVLSLNQQTTTPAGPTNQGVLVKEVLMDGSIEHKVYAADYGIVEDQADDEQLNLVLFNRADAQPGTVPEALSTIEAQAEDIIDIVPGGDWGQVSADVTATAQAWQLYQSQTLSDHIPQPFQMALIAALDRLQQASAAKQAAHTMQAANDVSTAVVDLYTVYHPALPTDVGQLDVLERQVLLDVASKDFIAAQDSLAKTDVIWVRLKPVILAHNGADAATQFEASLATQHRALSAKDNASLNAAADQGLALVDTIEQLFNARPRLTAAIERW